MKHTDYTESQLFALISNGESPNSIIQHAFNFPEEVGTWIVSRKESNSANEDLKDGDVHRDMLKETDVTWKYLPIHLVCLQRDPSKELLLVMRDVFPKGLKMRDYQGNLPIHYLLVEGCEDEEILDIATDDKYACLFKKDGEGRQMLEIIAQSTASNSCKKAMENWFNKRNTKQATFSPQLKASINQYDGTSAMTTDDGSCFHQLQNEVLMARTTMKELDSEIQKLRWECDAKDQTVDSLTAQLMSFEKKMKDDQMKSDDAEQQASASQADKQGEVVEKDDDDVVKTLKEKMDLDANIICGQEESIKELKSKLALSMTEGLELEKDKQKLQQQINLFDGKINQHDDVVEHVRKVSSIMQEELDTKEKDIATLSKQVTCLLTDKEELKRQIASMETEAEEKLERFQNSVRDQSESLSELLKTLKDKEAENEARISKDLRILKDKLTVKDEDLDSLKREVEAARGRNTNLVNMLTEKDNEINLMLQNVTNKKDSKDLELRALRQQHEDALEMNVDLTKRLAEKELELDKKLMLQNVTNKKDSKDLELRALRQQHEDALEMNVDLTNRLAEKELELDMARNRKDEKVKSNIPQPVVKTISSQNLNPLATEQQELHQSRPGSIEDFKGTTAETLAIAANDSVDIRERQARLQHELRDIYSQIKAAIPGHMMSAGIPMINSGGSSSTEESKEMKGGRDSTIADQVTQRLQDRRPWRVGAKDQNEVYNMEGWGQKTQRSTVYNI